MGNCTNSKARRSLLRSRLSQIFKNLDSEITECPICCNRYDLSERIPMMICFNQHNCCLLCYEALIAVYEYDSQDCPICRQTLIPKSSICKNRFLEGVLQSMPDKLPSCRDRKIQKTLNLAAKFGYQQVVYSIEKKVDLASTKQLLIWGCQIKSLIDLSIFENLEILDLHKNKISKMQHLSDLTSLKFLNLSNNLICKIEGLDGLQKLEMLDLSKNQINGTEGLPNLQSLSTLNLSHNQIKSLTGIYLLGSLQVLFLEGNRICKHKNSASIKVLQEKGLIKQLKSQNINA